MVWLGDNRLVNGSAEPLCVPFAPNGTVLLMFPR
jgi:hypothetical protein